MPTTLALGLAALILTACAMAMGGPPGPASRGVTGTPGAPFACALDIRQEGNAVALAGSVEARSALQGTYALRIRGAGTSIDQGGDFAARAGETVGIGDARLSGRAADLDATMTITVGGRSVPCGRR
jgi:hypothetical protein